MITAEDVIEVVGRLQGAGLNVWLDGGWAVDALVGEQTRSHDDLDLVIESAYTDKAIAALKPTGFRMDRDDRPTRFVLVDGRERGIDFHPIVFEVDGSARQIGAGPKGGDAVFPAEGFKGQGRIAGRPFACLSPGLLLRFHQGYPPQEKDRHNVGVLCERFGLAIPDGYTDP